MLFRYGWTKGIQGVFDMKVNYSGPGLGLLDTRYLNESSNLSDLDDAATARTNLGLDPGGGGDIWVEKAGDTMTGKLLVDFTGSGATDVIFSQVTTAISSPDVATNVSAFLADMHDDSGTGAASHEKRGFEVDNVMRHNLEGGHSKDYGDYINMGSLAEVPHGVWDAEFDVFGTFIKRDSICISDMDSGSWNNIRAYGIYLSGWKGASDDTSGLVNPITRYAIYSDGGNVELTDGNLTTTGTVTGVNVTSGEDPGHTHTYASIGDIPANEIDITDSGDYYTGTEVETALQEIGAGTTLDGRYVEISGDTMTGTLGTKGRIVNTTRQTTTYTVLVSDDSIYCDTDGGAWTATLPAGVDGQRFFITNCGSSGNDLTIDGNGSETINGEDNILLCDEDSIIIIFDSTEEWRIF